MLTKLQKIRRRNGGSSSSRRRLYPALESIEARLLLAANGFLQGTAYVDNNNDQKYDVGDQPLAGAKITVTNGSFSASMVTGADGAYTFMNLTPGNYQIIETPPSGYASSSAAANWSMGTSQVVSPNTINAQVIDPSQVYVNWIDTGACLRLGVYVQGPNLPLMVLAANVGELDGSLGTQPKLNDIASFVPTYCVDLYGDFNRVNTGFQITPTAGAGIQGNAAAVTYLLNEYQQSISTDYLSAVASADPAAIRHAQVEAAALQFAIWQFEYMPVPDPTLGNTNDPIYLVDPANEFEVVAQYDFYLNDAANAVASGFAQTEQALYLSANTPDRYQSLAASGSLNFGNVQAPTGSISGLKFNDVTGNGVYSPGQDAGLQGVTIALYQSGLATPIATTTTATDGTYSFGNLVPGTYTVQEIVPGGWTQTDGIGGYTITLTAGQNQTDVNFGDFQNISISGTKYNDLTGDGFSADDTVLGGVTINLYANGGSTPVATAVTDSNGGFQFTNLGPGTYFTQEIVPDGWTQTGGNAGYTVNAQSGQNITGENFDDFGDPAISGYKFNDLNANTVWDSGEPGVAGITIALYTDTNGVLTPVTVNGTPVTAVTSDGTNGPLGYYSFTHLPPLPTGTTYAVRENVPSGFAQTTPNPADVIARSGTTITNANFGDIAIATCACNLTGVTYKVTTPSGSSTTVTNLRGNTHQGDTVTAYFTVPAGQYDQLSLVSYNAPESFYSANTASLQTVYQQTSNVFGPGLHSITVMLPSNFYQVDFVCGTVIAQLGPAGSNNFYSAQNRLISADNGGTNAAGQNPLIVTGTVFADQNNDGTKQTGDAPLAGVTVTLTGTDAYGLAISQTAVTNAQGQYTITGMPISSAAGYKVTVTTPNGYWSGKATVGTAGGTATATPEAVTGIVLGGNTTSSLNNNFALVLPATISGTVYVDQTDLGYLTGTDKLLSGVTVTLTGTNDLGASVKLTTTTNSSGYYAFTGLRAGSYTLTETVPSAYSPASNNVGQINGSTPASVTVTKSPDAINGVPIQFGATGLNFNFGNLYNSGCSVAKGQTATIGFWQNKNGQALIKSFNGSSNATSLAQWLSTAFPNLYAAALSTTVNGQVTYATNTQVAAYYLTLFNAGGTKTGAQLLCAALGIYATTQSLGGTAGSSYGFSVSANGLGVSTYNVGSNGAAFGVANNTTLTVFQILNSLNVQAANGTLFAGNKSQSTLVNQANTILNGINTQGDI